LYEGGGVRVGVENINVVAGGDVLGEDIGGTLAADADFLGFGGVAAKAQFLDVENNLSDVFFDIGQRGELVQGTFEANRRDGGAAE